MVLQVLLAHNGHRLQTDASTFASLDAFKSWVSKHSPISAKDHIALTPSGKQVKLATLTSESEIFVYDGRIFQSSSAPNKLPKLDVPLPPQYSPSKPPDTITDQNDLQAWRDLFMSRRSWAIKVVDDCQAMSEEASQRYEELEIITRGVDAAVLNLEKHVKSLDQKNADAQSWAAEIKKEQDAAGADWEISLKRLRGIPADSGIINFITGRQRPKGGAATLEDLVNIEETKKAVKTISNVSSQLSKAGAAAGAKVDAIITRMDLLFDQVEKNPARAAISQAREPSQLMQDIEPIARKVSNDYESVLGYQDSPKSISQASKSALLHTKNFLPSLIKRSSEMYEMLRSVTELRNLVVREAIASMQDIATLTTMVGEANGQFTAMNLGRDTEDAFALVSNLNTVPLTYASLLAEAVRRREWVDKMRSDSSTLSNEMASFQEEEGKRRRRWQKNVGLSLWGERTEPQAMGLEVNLRGDEEPWPHAKREDIETLINSLKSQGTQVSIVADISKILQELNSPTKQQSKRAKAFKAGSIHEAALGKSGLLIRGDDELIRILQEEKQRTESKLRTAESRVRRLEDLLHRQSHVNRTSTGNVFQLPGTPTSELLANGNPMFSPRPDDHSRRSSVSSRRFSSNQGQEEKALHQRVLSLESELMAERDRSSGLQHQIVAGKTAATDLQGQVDEANSTKKDLMENFEAQQREFIDERKALENEIKRLKSKLEELEDEMDRYLGSRENERTNVDERVRALQDELESLRKETTADAQKAQGQVEFLRNETRMQRETNDSLEKQIQRLRDENRELERRAQRAETVLEEQQGTLVEIYQHLAPEKALPEESSVLAETLVSLCDDLFLQLESARNETAIAESERNTAHTAIQALKAEHGESLQKLDQEQTQGSELRQALDTERAKFTALESELTDGRSQLAELRIKIADGETGSEALRSRLEEEEKKVATMSADIAARFSRIGGLEEELRSLKEKHKSIQVNLENLSLKLDARSARARDLTKRTSKQNERLIKLLDRLSYSVSREGGSMVIQRIPRPDRSIHNANDSSDPGSNLKRSISGGASKTPLVDSGVLELLDWMQVDDVDAEAEKYDAFLNNIGSFDTEQFCEVITKRVKDMEYTAKKYLKDARSYREKSHTAQKEAHEKIAFKSFKEGDLALFLPTRNQASGAWAAFNVGAPHYFLREQDSHKLRSRDWLLARIHRIEDRVVDLSKSMSGNHLNASDGRSVGEASNGGDSFEDDNPFDLSDGLRWYLIDAAEEKPGAPSTPGLGKSTVASTHVAATGDIRRTKKSSTGGVEGINRSLSKSLDSRRSSTNSKKAAPGAAAMLKPGTNAGDNASLKSTSAAQAAGESSDAQIVKAVAKDIGGSAERSQTAEVGSQLIDDLLGP